MTIEPRVRERWHETEALLGAVLDPALLERLVAHYGERHRAYHDLRHVTGCLHEASAVRALLTAPALVELALWYHDVIYDPLRSDNEERSADFAVQELRLAPAPSETIRALILATRHDSVPPTPDAALVTDIDLSILGAPPAAFDAYDAAIRKEYGWVPAPLYRRKRRDVLQSFLDRQRIFSTDYFAERLEQSARANLARCIAGLS